MVAAVAAQFSFIVPVASASTPTTIIESDDDRARGSEVFLAVFDDLADLEAGTLATSGFADVNIGANFSIGGAFYDGGYTLVLESDDDRGRGSEVALATFNDLGDLETGTLATSVFTDVNVGANFSIGGAFYDGSYTLVLESDDDRGRGSEVALATFDSLADLETGTLSSSRAANIDIGAGFSIGGAFYDEDPSDDPDPTTVIPLPAGMPLLLGGLAVLGFVRRRATAA